MNVEVLPLMPLLNKYNPSKPRTAVTRAAGALANAITAPAAASSSAR